MDEEEEQMQEQEQEQDYAELSKSEIQFIYK